jgi:neurofibromin 1
MNQQMDRLQKDLDHACLRAIVGLLHKLPLQPSEAIRPVDISQIKSKLFLKYFGFFRKLLDTLKQTERDSQKYSYTTMASKDPSAKTFSSANNDSYQDINQMKEMTIMAMSHLLSANVDAGLKFSLSMSYDDDHETRKAFMQVLTNILDQGAEFETLAESVITDRYEKLIDVCFKHVQILMN